jgi:hypothetical protein
MTATVVVVVRAFANIEALAQKGQASVRVNGPAAVRAASGLAR